MSQKEADRLHIMKLLESKRINLKKATELMKLSKRQAIRIKYSYLKSGIKGLISKRRGKPSPNKISDEIKQKTASVIREKYYDFGPTLAKEKLEKNEDLKMAVETIRQIMIKEELWKIRLKSVNIFCG